MPDSTFEALRVQPLAVPNPAIGAVHFELRVPPPSHADYVRSQKLVMAPFTRRGKWVQFAAWLVFVVGVPLAALFWARSQGSYPYARRDLGLSCVIFFFAGFFAYAALVSIYTTMIRRAMHAAMPRAPWLLLVGEQGTQSVIEGASTVVLWSQVGQVLRQEHATFIPIIERLQQFIIPHAAFENPAQQEAFMDFVRQRTASHRDVQS